MSRALALAAATALLAVGGAPAQSLRLAVSAAVPAAALDAAEPPVVPVGGTLTVVLEADLESLDAAGLAAFLTVPEAIFEVHDLGLSGQAGVQPFRLEQLFAGAQVATNLLLGGGDPVGLALPDQQLDLAVILGPGTVGAAGGHGPVAAFELRALAAADRAHIAIDSSPVRETRLVLADGRTERRFRALAGLTVRVVEPPASPVRAGTWSQVKSVALAPRD